MAVRVPQFANGRYSEPGQQAPHGGIGRTGEVTNIDFAGLNQAIRELVEVGNSLLKYGVSGQWSYHEFSKFKHKVDQIENETRA